jgi:glutathione S-transferase
LADYTLVIGNKNYSSWSLRAWLMMKATGTPFKEILIPLYQENSKQDILRYSPSGKVPVLIAEGMPVWDSMAIGEYLAETFPAAQLWPENKMIRAHARSICAEMHSGFAELRKECSMNMKKRDKATPSPEVAAQVARIERLWTEARRMAGQGDFLYGHFTIADAMYAPVVSRFVSYRLGSNPESRRYMDAVWAHPAFGEWLGAALLEPWEM